MILIYTDASVKGNIAICGAIALRGTTFLELSNEKLKTSIFSKSELLAVKLGLLLAKTHKYKNEQVLIYSDSLSTINLYNQIIGKNTFSIVNTNMKRCEKLWIDVYKLGKETEAILKFIPSHQSTYNLNNYIDQYVSAIRGKGG